MQGFRKGKFDVLIATDLASRGIDVTNISHIVNYDIPEDPEVYVHRVGRTARMGAKGKAFTFVGKDQGEQLTKVESLINMIVPQATVEGFEARPTPADWTEGRPGDYQPSTPAKPTQSRFERPYNAGGSKPSTPATSRQRCRAGHGRTAANNRQQDPREPPAQAALTDVSRQRRNRTARSKQSARAKASRILRTS